MLSIELEKSNGKTYHASGDADVLIVQKAVQSATISKTVLIGEDTDLIVQLYYHASFDSQTSSFILSQRKTQKGLRLEHQSHKRKAWSRHLQQHPLYPWYSWV